MCKYSRVFLNWGILLQPGTSVLIFLFKNQSQGARVPQNAKCVAHVELACGPIKEENGKCTITVRKR